MQAGASGAGIGEISGFILLNRKLSVMVLVQAGHDIMGKAQTVISPALSLRQLQRINRGAAPVGRGQTLGKVIIKLDDEEILNTPIVAMQAVGEGSFIDRTLDSIKLMFK